MQAKVAVLVHVKATPLQRIRSMILKRKVEPQIGGPFHQSLILDDYSILLASFIDISIVLLRILSCHEHAYCESCINLHDACMLRQKDH